MRLGLLEYFVVRTEELARHRLDIEGLIMALLDRQWRDAELIAAECFQVKHRQPLSGDAQLIAASQHRDAPKHASPLGIALVLHIHEMPALLRAIAEHKQRIWEFFQHALDQSALVG